MLSTSKEKLALFIGTNFGDDARKEWLSEKQLVLVYVDMVLYIDLTSTPIPHATMTIAGVLQVMRIQ